MPEISYRIQSVFIDYNLKSRYIAPSVLAKATVGIAGPRSSAGDLDHSSRPSRTRGLIGRGLPEAWLLYWFSLCRYGFL
jgi:hypothetical protein